MMTVTPPPVRERQHRVRKPSKSIAVIDIGSNSVRLVVYEDKSRTASALFNEKTLCGLGREVQSTGLLAADAVEKALAALKRFKALCKVMKVGEVFAIATAACRDATNGPDFIAKAERLCGCSIEILSGAREAKLSALGVSSGVYKPDGIVGDLERRFARADRHSRTSYSPGTHAAARRPLRYKISSQKSLKKAEKIVSDAITGLPQLKAGTGRNFYAVGGT